jgi:phage terminase small subunit
MEQKLNKRQALFVAEYCKCLNASEAARRAGYSEKSAKRLGYDNMHKPYIKAAIAERLEHAEKRNSADADEALDILWQIARGETTDDITIFIDKGVQDVVEARTPTSVRKQAAEALLKLYTTADKDAIAKRKLKAEADKAERENGSHELTGRVIIAQNTDEMRRVMNERNEGTDK